MTLPNSDRSWTVTQHRDGAAALHGIELPASPVREVWILTPVRPALVLGSTQADAVADAEVLARRGIDLVRRRSGGGAVLLDPLGTVGGFRSHWIDLVIPRSDPLWSDDVGRSMAWVGEAWVRALAVVGVEGEVHRGSLERTTDSTLVCFAGLGSGEVVVEGRKVVGISQRRTRFGARFQCVVHLAAADGSAGVPPSLAAIVDLLREPADGADRAQLAAFLRERTAVVDANPAVITDALVAALPGGGG